MDLDHFLTDINQGADDAMWRELGQLGVPERSSSTLSDKFNTEDEVYPETFKEVVRRSDSFARGCKPSGQLCERL